MPIDATTPYFRITILDEATNRGIPAVRVTTMHQAVYWTDSAGVIAFHEPGLNGQHVYLQVYSDGYQVIPDGSGAEDGITFLVTPGGSATIRMKRLLAAQRIYRITGADIYRDSLILGDEVPTARSGLNSQVTGQDSTLTTKYKGRIFWVWGDTMSPRFSYHWNFKVTSAVSELPDNGGLDPDKGVDLKYFEKEDGFTRQTTPIPGPHLYWLAGLLSLKDDDGRERMFSTYLKVEPGGLVGDRVDEDEKDGGKKKESDSKKKTNTPGFRVIGFGMVEYNDEKGIFELLSEYPMDSTIINCGHVFQANENGTDYIYYPAVWPAVRVKADVKSLLDPKSVQAFTCLKAGSKFDNTDQQIDRDENGDLRWAWRENTSAIGPREQWQLIQSGHIKQEEGWVQFRETETGERIATQHCSVHWNEYRQRYIMTTGQAGGHSALGEILYAEADSPIGPWVYTQKIVTHNDYSFYNPCQHPLFAQNGGRTIFFEGTYTRMFSTNPVGTPRYNYNQIMYKLELDDPRIILPVPVYRLEGEAHAYRTKNDIAADCRAVRTIPFFAPDRPREGTVPVYESVDPKSGGVLLSLTKPDGDSRIAFYAQPVPEKAQASDTDEAASSPLVPLHEFVNRVSGKRIYATTENVDSHEYEKSEKTVCLVWANPSTFNPFNVA